MYINSERQRTIHSNEHSQYIQPAGLLKTSFVGIAAYHIHMGQLKSCIRIYMFARTLAQRP